MPPIPEQNSVVIQFAKWPEEGRVKTRLIPALGARGAMEAHVRLSLAVLDNLVASDYPVQFWWDAVRPEPPEAAAPILARLTELGIVQSRQQGETLGDRMVHALGTALVDHDKAIIVGSDCPAVDPGYVRQAFAALDATDMVMGPSDDGGYVLIGARRVRHGMLDGIAWGTERVLFQTCERFDAQGINYGLLPPRWDVDEPEDWRRFLDQSPA